jgi:hypothetical protein
MLTLKTAKALGASCSTSFGVRKIGTSSTATVRLLRRAVDPFRTKSTVGAIAYE